MFVKVFKRKIHKRLESIQELREEFPHMSFPTDDEFRYFREEVGLPAMWYFEDSKVVQEMLNEKEN